MGNKGAGQRIQYLRKLNGYTRETFSEKVKISSKFLYEIELGRKGFSAEVLLSIAKNLAVSCDYIMTGKGEIWQDSNQMTVFLENVDSQKAEDVKEILLLLRAKSAD